MKLFLKKLFTAPLYILSWFAGVFGFVTVLNPLNLPYLLKINEDVMFVIYIFLGVIFASTVAVVVRSRHLQLSDSCEQKSEKSLFVRVVTSREYWMEVAACALLAAVFFTLVSQDIVADFLVAVVGTVMLTLAVTIPFAVVDCLIWMISYKRVQID